MVGGAGRGARVPPKRRTRKGRALRNYKYQQSIQREEEENRTVALSARAIVLRLTGTEIISDGPDQQHQIALAARRVA